VVARRRFVHREQIVVQLIRLAEPGAILCRVDDSVVRLGVIQGEYHWHKYVSWKQKVKFRHA
jgi:hypothetical protein